MYVGGRTGPLATRGVNPGLYWVPSVTVSRPQVAGHVHRCAQIRLRCEAESSVFCAPATATDVSSTVETDLEDELHLRIWIEEHGGYVSDAIRLVPEAACGSRGVIALRVSNTIVLLLISSNDEDILCMSQGAHVEGGRN